MNTARFDMRLPAGLKKLAEKKAAKERRKLADYIRVLIEKDVASSSQKK